ncbi:MAG: hypothetical protein ABIJ39_06145 [Chloroflexota bacterium]
MKKRAIRIFIMTVLICVACQTATDRDQPAQEPTPPLQPTSTSPVVPGVTVTPEATPTPQMGVDEMFLELNQVSPGQYLMIYFYEEDVKYIELLTPEMNVVKRVPIDANIDWIVTSASGNQLMVTRFGSDMAYLYDIFTQQVTEHRFIVNCDSPTWSPDGDMVALTCINDSMNAVEIYLLDVETGSMERITDCEERHLSCASASWSFDGRWLAYNWDEGRSGTHFSRGVYIFDTSCIEVGNCMENQIGPLPEDGGPIWTPTNELVVAVGDDLRFYTLIDNIPVLTRTISTDVDFYRTIRVSPDGEYLSLVPVYPDTVQNYSLTSNRFGPLLERGGNPMGIAGWIVIP